MEMLLICRVTWAVLAEQVLSFDAAREWGFLGGIFAVKGMFPSLLAQGEGLGKGKGAVCLLSVFTAGKQTPVGGFVTLCESCLACCWEALVSCWRCTGSLPARRKNEAAGF